MYMLRVKPTFEMLFSTAADRPNYRTKFRDLRQLRQSLKQSPTPQALEDYKKLLGQSKTLGNAYISGKRVLPEMIALMQKQVQQADPGWQSESAPQETSLFTDDPIPDTIAPATPMEPELVNAEPFRNTEQLTQPGAEQLTQPDIGQPETGNLEQEIDDITKQWGEAPKADTDQIRQELEQDIARDDPFQQALDQAPVAPSMPTPTQFKDGPEAAIALHAAMQAFGKQMNESAIRPYNAVAPQLMEVARWARKGINATPEQIQGTGSLIDMLNRGMEAQQSVSAYMQAIATSAEDALTLWGYSKGQTREDVAKDWGRNRIQGEDDLAYEHVMSASAGSAMKKLSAGSGMKKLAKGLSMNRNLQVRLAKKIAEYKQASKAFEKLAQSEEEQNRMAAELEATRTPAAPDQGVLAQLAQQLQRLMGEITGMLQQVQTATGAMNSAPGGTTPPTTNSTWRPDQPQATPQNTPPETGKGEVPAPIWGRPAQGYEGREPSWPERASNWVSRGVKAPFRAIRDMGRGFTGAENEKPVLTASMGSAASKFLK